MKGVLTNENIFTVSRVGSALEADKKINLAPKISVWTFTLREASRTTVKDDRLMFEAMVYILRVDAPGAIFQPYLDRGIPFGTRWRRWCLSGLWEKLLRTLARKA